MDLERQQLLPSGSQSVSYTVGSTRIVDIGETKPKTTKNDESQNFGASFNIGGDSECC